MALSPPLDGRTSASGSNVTIRSGECRLPTMEHPLCGPASESDAPTGSVPGDRVKAGYSVLFLAFETLMTRPNRGRHENRLERTLQQLVDPHVLILDVVGYLPLSRDEARLFFRLLARRYEWASLILTTSKGFLDRSEIFNEQVPATAVLDRLLHHATTIKITGESYRLEEKRKAGLLGRGIPIQPEGLEIAQEARASPSPGTL